MLRERRRCRKASRPPRREEEGKQERPRRPAVLPYQARLRLSWPAPQVPRQSGLCSPPLIAPRSASAQTAQKIVSAHKISRETTTVSSPRGREFREGLVTIALKGEIDSIIGA